jgi:hypothetical protein
MTAEIESHSPQLGERRRDRRPHAALLTTGMEQQDGRPGTGRRTSQQCVASAESDFRHR